MKSNTLSAAVRIGMLALLMLLLKSLLGTLTAPLLNMKAAESAAIDPGRSMMGIAAAALVHVCVISLLIVRSHRRGPRLALAVAAVFYGVRRGDVLLLSTPRLCPAGYSGWRSGSALLYSCSLC